MHLVLKNHLLRTLQQLKRNEIIECRGKREIVNFEKWKCWVETMNLLSWKREYVMLELHIREDEIANFDSRETGIAHIN